MRFVKEHLEVITCYIPSAHEITSTIESFDELKLCKDHFPPNTCFNVFWFNQKSWAPPTCRFISEYFDTLKELSSAKEGSMAVVRLCALDKQRESTPPKKVVTSGSGFYMLPNLVITNCHVNEKIGTNPCFAFSNSWNIGYFDDALKQVEQLPEKKRLCFSGQLLKLTPYETKFKQTKIWTGIGAITGEIGDFSFFDFSAVLFTGKPNNVIFIPSSTVLQPGDEIITLSYPGDEENTSPLKDYANYASWAPSELFMKSNIFNGYGTLCASFGKILHPFRNINDEWEKDEEFRYNSSNQECLASSECLFFGSSGGVMISKSCQVHHVNNLTLVEFHAIHVGGEFVRCNDCLRKHSVAMREFWEDNHNSDQRIKVDCQPQDWRICEKCLNDSDLNFNNPLSYSNSISVHSKPFVEFFEMIILPELKKLINVSDVSSLVEYCQEHGINY